MYVWSRSSSCRCYSGCGRGVCGCCCCCCCCCSGGGNITLRCCTRTGRSRNRGRKNWERGGRLASMVHWHLVAETQIHLQPQVNNVEDSPLELNVIAQIFHQVGETRLDCVSLVEAVAIAYGKCNYFVDIYLDRGSCCVDLFCRVHTLQGSSHLADQLNAKIFHFLRHRPFHSASRRRQLTACLPLFTGHCSSCGCSRSR